MMLESVLQAILAAGVVTPDELIRGETELVDVSRRNAAVVVRRKKGGSAFVKAAPPVDGALPSWLATEWAACVRIARDAPDHVPRALVRADHEGWIALEAIDEATTLTKVWLNAGEPEIEPGVGEVLGEILASIHALDAPVEVPQRGLYVLDQKANHGLGGALERWPEAARLLADLRATNAYHERLADAADAWGARRDLVHNDLRADNVLVARAGPPVRVVDWELASQGDGAWDLASLAAEVVRFWATQSIRTTGDPTRPAPAGTFRWSPDPNVLLALPLDAGGPFLDALVRAYAEPAGVERRELERRIRTFLPAALLRVAIETSREPGPSRSALATHVARAAFEDPARVLADLGLGADA